ncbi:MAG TPA: tetratricopeptide repeat protein [Flavobacterium sp.]|jgi:tetratricopeptide (TPR) repeat protein
MKQLIIYSVLLCIFTGFAQERDPFLPKANKEFADKKYVDAEANYRISASKFPKKAVASYNLGNTIYRINQPAEAGIAYKKSITDATSRTEKHQALHNLGNVFMKQKDYTNAVAAYKNALINDPSDEETRYNYALAKKMLKENPPKKDDKKDKNKDKNKDKKEDKDKDKKDGDKDKKDEKDKKDDKKAGEGKDKKDEKPDNGKPKPQPGGISKERLQNLLDAVNNEEKKVQEKVNKNKVKAKSVQTEKDW